MITYQTSGVLAKEAGKNLPLMVLKSRAGYYIGTCEDGIPYSRESIEYFESSAKAEYALEQKLWTQRSAP
ncbi:MAG TPA: hypothetical protein ENI98_10035 [Gammaproteobacteria bacterium]|nr:hypothetical protein [Gammaproteobacteria bacterium]